MQRPEPNWPAARRLRGRCASVPPGRSPFLAGISACRACSSCVGSMTARHTTSWSSTTSCASMASRSSAAVSLDLAADAGSLTAALIDVASVSGFETELAVAVDAALRDLQYLEVERHGNVVLARTDLG